MDAFTFDCFCGASAVGDDWPHIEDGEAADRAWHGGRLRSWVRWEGFFAESHERTVVAVRGLPLSLRPSRTLHPS